MNALKNKLSEAAMQRLHEAADFAGRVERESFIYNIGSECVDLGMQSPLEHILYVAMQVVMRVNLIDMARPLTPNEMDEGISILPQHKIDAYRADFFVSYFPCGSTAPTRSVVVECDGTAFHERTEDERRLEKRRDRHMQKRDLKVFRYTGKEIMSNPYKIAAEIIGYVTDMEADIVTPAEYFA